MNRKDKTMIELKAKVENINDKSGEAEVSVSCHLSGTGEMLVHEATTTIRSLLGHMKETSELLHLMVIQSIASDPTILFGEDPREDALKAEFASMNSKNIIKKGVN